MHTFVLIIHYFVCAFLVVVILLQAGKGADIGAAFGAGSSQTLFGPRGAATFLNKLTAVVAGVFLLTSLGLVSLSQQGGAGRSVLEKVPVTAPPSPPAQAEPVEEKPVDETPSGTEAPLTTPETQQ